MKKILLFIVCIIACTFVACSDDEKDAGEKAKESVANTSWFHYRGTDEYRIYFYDNHQFSISCPYATNGNGTYTQKGDIVTFSGAGTLFEAAWKIAKLKIGTISYAGTSMDVKIEDALNGGTETWKFQLDLTK